MAVLVKQEKKILFSLFFQEVYSVLSPSFKKHPIKKSFQVSFSKVKSLLHLVKENRQRSRYKRLNCRGKKADRYLKMQICA